MHWPSLILLAVLVSTGCRSSTIETRRVERSAAYEALSAEWKELVDNGQIKVGMSQDAVFIAWGPPSQVLQRETTAGLTTTWLYHSTYMEETRYWAFREVYRGNQPFLERYLERTYDPRDYVRAEITFRQGVVSEWSTLPRPTGRGARP